MANLAMTPTQLSGGASLLSVTGALASLSTYTTVSFTNDGQSFLLISNGATAGTVTVSIAQTVEGQAVTSIGPLTVAATTVYTLGAFDAAYSAGFNGTVTVTLGTPTTFSAVLLRPVGTK